ncbi:MAG TPA: LacI family DNA-binding transcriptional regulator [Anaerolineales bacterium]
MPRHARWDYRPIEKDNMPKEGSPTIYDVAALAGMSIATISRVLNSPERVTDVTRVKVLAAIDQLGYIPKAEARARALQRTRRIGVLTPFFTAPSFVQRLRGIAAALTDNNFELIIYTIESLSRLKGYLATLPLTGDLDGLIVVSLPLAVEEMERLTHHQLETVVIESKQRFFSSVEIDDHAGGRMAAQYLLGRGHCHFGFLGDIHPPEYAIHPIIARLAGFQDSLLQAGIHLPKEAIQSASYDQEISRQAARKLLSLPVRPTAIFAASDVQAIAVMKVAGEYNLKIPQDLAVIGFDDLEMADYVGLTTIRQPLDDSGRLAAEILTARLVDPRRPVQHIQLPLTLVERETV